MLLGDRLFALHHQFESNSEFAIIAKRRFLYQKSKEGTLIECIEEKKILA